MRAATGSFGAAGAEAVGFEGEAPKSTQTNRAKMRLDPLCNFVLLAHPFRFDVALTEDGPKLLPRLRFFYFEPGVSGVEQVRGNHPDGTPITDGNAVRALANLATSGWTVIDPDMVVEAFGVKRKGYSVRYADGYKGPVHLSAWHKPYALGGKVEIDFDEAGWHRFLGGLLDSGIVPPPTSGTSRAMRVKLERAMRKRANHATTNATAHAAAELYEQKLRALPTRAEAAAEKRSAPAAEPKAKPGPKPKVEPKVEPISEGGAT